MTAAAQRGEIVVRVVLADAVGDDVVHVDSEPTCADPCAPLAPQPEAPEGALANPLPLYAVLHVLGRANGSGPGCAATATDHVALDRRIAVRTVVLRMGRSPAAGRGAKAFVALRANQRSAVPTRDSRPPLAFASLLIRAGAAPLGRGPFGCSADWAHARRRAMMDLGAGNAPLRSSIYWDVAIHTVPRWATLRPMLTWFAADAVASNGSTAIRAVVGAILGAFHTRMIAESAR